MNSLAKVIYEDPSELMGELIQKSFPNLGETCAFRRFDATMHIENIYMLGTITVARMVATGERQFK